MIIAVAGPYSAPTDEQKKENLEQLNRAAAILYQKGHVPVIGVNAALPVLEQVQTDAPNKIIMDISMAVMECCEALLLIAESPGANRERDFILSKGLPVYYTIEEIPDEHNA